MTDERLARQMVQYHIEGEHVFPEPECASCRLVEALRRAAESVRLLRSDKDDAHQGRYLAGWAEAIRALDEDKGRKTRAKAIASFIKAMLGGSHG